MIEDMDKEETEEKIELFESSAPPPPPMSTIPKQNESEKIKVTTHEVKETTQIPVTIVTNTRATVMPQLSPLSQPSELTSNIANGSQQLRTLLSSFTTTVTSSSNVGTIAKAVSYKEKQSNLLSNQVLQTSRMLTQQHQQQQQQQNNAGSPTLGSVIVPNIKQTERKIVSPKTSPTTTSMVTTTNTMTCSQSQIVSTATSSTQSKFVHYDLAINIFMLFFFCRYFNYTYYS